MKAIKKERKELKLYIEDFQGLVYRVLENTKIDNLDVINMGIVERSVKINDEISLNVWIDYDYTEYEDQKMNELYQFVLCFDLTTDNDSLFLGEASGVSSFDIVTNFKDTILDCFLQFTINSEALDAWIEGSKNA